MLKMLQTNKERNSAKQIILWSRYGTLLWKSTTFGKIHWQRFPNTSWCPVTDDFQELSCYTIPYSEAYNYQENASMSKVIQAQNMHIHSMVKTVVQ